MPFLVTQDKGCKINIWSLKCKEFFNYFKALVRIDIGFPLGDQLSKCTFLINSIVIESIGRYSILDQKPATVVQKKWFASEEDQSE